MRKILPCLVILVFSIFLTYEYSKDIHLYLLQASGSPIDYLNQKLSPDNFSKDFLGTAWATHYDRTVIMKTFYWAKTWFGISAETFIYPFMFFQVAFVIYAIYFLLGAIFPTSGLACLIIIPVLLTQWIAGVDLSRFGTGMGSLLQIPLYYGWAWGSFFMALGFSLRRNINMMFLFLALTCICHITIGVLSSAFIGAWYLLNLKQCMNKKFLTAFGLFVLVVVFHVLSNVGLSPSTITHGAMAKSDWLKMTMLHCYHWYPITMGMFSIRGVEINLIARAFLLFALVACFFDWRSDVFKKIISGIVVSILFILAGVFFAEIMPIPLIIKISPQRISSLMSFVMVACFLSVLVHRFGLFFKNERYKKWALFTVGVFSLIYAGRDIQRTIKTRISMPAVVQSYMDAQLWAKANTAANALFVVDPSSGQNWQNFSVRSSYGTFRDWGFTGLAYDSNERLFQEGKRRANLFGVDVDKISVEELKAVGGAPIWRQYLPKIRDTYYSMTSTDLQQFAEQEGADYFVFEKEQIKPEIKPSLKIAFENQHYVIAEAK